MPQPDYRHFPARLSVLAIALLISACASRSMPEPQVTEEPPPAAEPVQPAEEAVPDTRTTTQPAQTEDERCAWSRIRGVATLLAIARGATARGTWQFFPGDDIVFHPVPESAEEGDEFRALLQRPLRGPCGDPRLVLFSPL